MVLPIEAFSNIPDRQYQGGLSFVLTSNDNPANIQFYKLGLARKDLNYISLSNPMLLKQLSLDSQANIHALTPDADHRWFSFICQSH